MTTRERTTATPLFALVAACCGLVACADYTAETTVNADGSGLREVWVKATDAPDSPAEREEFVALTHLSQREGWTHGFSVESDGDTVFTFHKSTPVPDLASWSGVSGSLTIDGTTPAYAQERVGYVRLGDVRFRNSVRVARGRTSDGTTTLRYQETFTWEQALDVLGEVMVRSLDAQMVRRFPRLAPEERGQIAGAFRTRFWMMVDAGILDEGSESDLEALVLDVVEGDEISDEVDKKLPGVDLGFNTSIVFRLRLPGEVTSSNAHRDDDGVLVWEFGPDDTLLAPVEIRAESVVGR